MPTQSCSPPSLPGLTAAVSTHHRCGRLEGLWVGRACMALPLLSVGFHPILLSGRSNSGEKHPCVEAEFLLACESGSCWSDFSFSGALMAGKTSV